jgi:hypothetical protein
MSRHISLPAQDTTGECRWDYRWSACHKAGGRWFKSIPGQPGSSVKNVSPNLVAGTDIAKRGECRWDYRT